MRPACLPDRDTTGAAMPPLIALLGVLLAAPATAQVDTSEWTCEFCPFAEGYRARLEAGADYVSDDALRFGNGSGYDEKGVYAALDGEGHYAKDGYQLDWFAEDLGRSSRAFDVDGGRQGRFDFHLGYRELPYRRFDSTSSVYSAAGADTLNLPAGWVRAGTTGGFTALAASLRPQDVESDRNILTAGGRVTLGAGFDFHASYERQERDGVDIVSGANYTQSSLLPRFLDFQTDLVDLGIGYSGGAFNLSLAWFGSFFDNKVDSLTWDNAFTSPAGFELRRMAQEPDNDFQQVGLSGSYHAPVLDSVLSFAAATGQGTQDDSLLPYSVNAAAGGGPLPRSTLNGKVDTTNYALTYTARPFERANLKLAYRYDERKNKTPQAAWTRVITDTFPSGESELNTPYSYKRRYLSASAGYRLFDTLKLSAGYDRHETDRDYQEVAEQTEDSGWGRIRWQATEWLDVDARGGAARRDIGRYDLTVAQDLGQNPLLLVVPAAVAASCAFMLPVATPPNAIVFGSGYVTIPQMVRSGFGLNVIGIFLTVAITYVLVIPVFDVVINQLPFWVQAHPG